MLTTKQSKSAKVLLCGMKNVGKTCLIEQLIYGNVTLETKYNPTIEDIYIASVDTGKSPRESLRIFDTAGIQGKAEYPKHYHQFPDAYILVYDPQDPASLDMLADIKSDIDRNKEKKEAVIIVLANVHSNVPDSGIDSHKANNWCAREKIKHYTVNAMERASLYEPFVSLTIRLHPAQSKSTFTQFSKVMQKTKSD
uniref:NF-kappa-B inhibitor-interacting Ras-like protein n=1 Tax=Megaselia scalaris TaxID=36166 RepID=T1H660_MEGSC